MNRQRGSLAGRLVLAVTLLVTAMWLMAAFGAALVQRHELNEVLDNALRETALRLSLLPETPDDWPSAFSRRQDDYLDYRLLDANGLLVAGTGGAADMAVSVPLAEGFVTTATRRVYTVSLPDGLFLQVGEPLRHRREGMMEAALFLLLPLLPAIPLCIGGVWWVVRRNLLPVRVLQQRIGARGGDDMTPVSGDDLPQELRPVADSVSRLLQRLKQVLEAERAFTANSAHELRTPIAAALAQVQRLAAELPQTPSHARIRTVEAALQRLGRLSEKLLQLSRAEAGGAGLAGPAEDMLPVLRLVAGEFRSEAGQTPDIRLERGAVTSLPLRMDPDGFAILLRNLIENALLHGAPDSPVEILADRPGCLRVINHGPVVPAAHLSRLTRRFERGGATKPGSGLGLAIASTLATQAGGRLTLYSPARDRADGFEAVFDYPVPAATPAGARPA